MSYQGPENADLIQSHELPLTAVLNVLKDVPSHSDPCQRATRDHCPLHNAGYLLHNMPKASSLPYATNHTLIAHANAVLELIDQQFSAKGGLLSVLPPEGDKDARKQAETTILGQYILYTQRLVERLHDLKIQYSNSLDLLAGQSQIPYQTLSALGPDGRKGRELVYPQDKFVLVHAGQDVLAHLDREFTRKEAADSKRMQKVLEQGLTGEELWEEEDGTEYDRGITVLDITTRYYRLRNDPLKAIFVIPAYEKHPGVSSTLDLESRPTVVSVVQPVWPERVPLLEQKHRDHLSKIYQFERENEVLKQKFSHKEDEVIFWRLEVEKTSQRNRELERKIALIRETNESGVATKIEELEGREERILNDGRSVEELRVQAEKIKAEAIAERAAARTESLRRLKEIDDRQKAAEDDIRIRMRSLQELERELKRRADVLEEESQQKLQEKLDELNSFKDAFLDKYDQLKHHTANSQTKHLTIDTTNPSATVLPTPTAAAQTRQENAHLAETLTFPIRKRRYQPRRMNSFKGIVGMNSLHTTPASSPTGSVGDKNEIPKNNFRGEGRALRNYTGTPVLQAVDDAEMDDVSDDGSLDSELI